MNQILATENSNNKNRKKHKKSSGGAPRDIFSISKFFAVALLVFGVFLIASSSYALYKGQNNKTVSEQKNALKPTVMVEEKEETGEILITVIHEGTAIKEVEYYWGQEASISKDGQERTYMQFSIEMPTKTDVLTVIATDINGNQTKVTEEFKVETDASIDIQQSGNNVKVTLKSEKEIQNVTYSWDETSPEKIDVNKTEYSFEIETLIGEHELKVVSTDIDGNKEEKTITVKGYTKPTATIEAGEDCYVIKAHDDVGLTKVVIETVEDGNIKTMESDGKDFQFEFPLKENSENYIKVTAYNKYGVKSRTRKAVWNK